MSDAARDIDLVLATGAGASREFGAQGKKLLLMGDWSELAMKKLAQRGSNLVATVDLEVESGQG